MQKMKWVIAMGLVAAAAKVAAASTVWSIGPNDVNFSMPSGGDPAVGANQDHITDNVWITRGVSEGLFNIKTEDQFNDSMDVSPADTLWAFSGVNGNPTFLYGQGAADFKDLSFASWETSLGGMKKLQSNITSSPGVVYLMTDDVYFDIEFTFWGSHGDGGFTYTRAANPAATVPEPASVGLLLGGAVALLGIRRGRRNWRRIPGT